MTDISKQWAAVRGERVIGKRDSKDALRTMLRKQDIAPNNCEIVAVPKPHTSITFDTTQNAG